MPTTVGDLARTDEIRAAIRFVRYLRGPVWQDADWHHCRQLRDAWHECNDSPSRFQEVCESVNGNHRIEWCDDCDEPTWARAFYGGTGDGTRVCGVCFNEHYHYCDECEAYYDEPHSHQSGSLCEVPEPEFEFPLADGKSVECDVLLDVETPAGLISESGIQAVADYLYGELSWYGIFAHVRHPDFSHDWTNKQGNFPKRVAKLALQHGYKLSPPVMAHVGNIARAHTSSGTTHRVEFTRDLNADAENFAYEGSCWWGSEYHSRCALKQMGGFGIRTFDTPGRVSGRAWLLPLKNNGESVRLVDDGDPMDADAFVIFNAYEHEGYEFARIVAQLTGMSYRRIQFQCNPMYVNNAAGYLVAPAQVCQRIMHLGFDIVLRCGC